MANRHMLDEAARRLAAAHLLAQFVDRATAGNPRDVKLHHGHSGVIPKGGPAGGRPEAQQQAALVNQRAAQQAVDPRNDPRDPASQGFPPDPTVTATAMQQLAPGARQRFQAKYGSGADAEAALQRRLARKQAGNPIDHQIGDQERRYLQRRKMLL